MSVSVVIPVYNYAHYLERAVRSVIEQNQAPVDIILVDDGSTDDSPEVIRSLSDRYPGKLTHFRQENAGPGAARNAGVARSSGSHMLFLDADDDLTPNAVEDLERVITANPSVGVLVADHISVSEAGKEKVQSGGRLAATREARLEDFLLRRTLSVNNGASAIHRSVFDDYGFPSHFRNGEDIALFAYALANFDAARVPSVLTRRYRHAGSLRTNVEGYAHTATLVVEEVFDHDRIPQSMAYLRQPFLARRFLSLSRQWYDTGDYAACLKEYRHGLGVHAATALKWTYLKNAVRALPRLALGAGRT